MKTLVDMIFDVRQYNGLYYFVTLFEPSSLKNKLLLPRPQISLRPNIKYKNRVTRFSEFHFIIIGPSEKEEIKMSI